MPEQERPPEHWKPAATTLRRVVPVAQKRHASGLTVALSYLGIHEGGNGFLRFLMRQAARPADGPSRPPGWSFASGTARVAPSRREKTAAAARWSRVTPPSRPTPRFWSSACGTPAASTSRSCASSSWICMAVPARKGPPGRVLGRSGSTFEPFGGPRGPRYPPLQTSPLNPSPPSLPVQHKWPRGTARWPQRRTRGNRRSSPRRCCPRLRSRNSGK
jgi:hypothetical protein